MLDRGEPIEAALEGFPEELAPPDRAQAERQTSKQAGGKRILYAAER